jgi:hypothetical protein
MISLSVEVLGFPQHLLWTEFDAEMAAFAAVILDQNVITDRQGIV